MPLFTLLSSFILPGSALLLIYRTYKSVALGGLVVSVLTTGPKVRGFDPGRGRWIFKGDKIRGEVKSSVPYSIDLRHVKEPYGHE
jgi:hypothetical protein